MVGLPNKEVSDKSFRLMWIGWCSKLKTKVYSSPDGVRRGIGLQFYQSRTCLRIFCIIKPFHIWRQMQKSMDKIFEEVMKIMPWFTSQAREGTVVVWLWEQPFNKRKHIKSPRILFLIRENRLNLPESLISPSLSVTNIDIACK